MRETILATLAHAVARYDLQLPAELVVSNRLSIQATNDTPWPTPAALRVRFVLTYKRRRTSPGDVGRAGLVKLALDNMEGPLSRIELQAPP
jgi:hypothetical protein